MLPSFLQMKVIRIMNRVLWRKMKNSKKSFRENINNSKNSIKLLREEIQSKPNITLDVSQNYYGIRNTGLNVSINRKERYIWLSSIIKFI